MENLAKQLHPETRDDRPDPLDYWLEQERARGLDENAGALRGPEPMAEDDAMPSGWWILPALALSLPIWGAILSALFFD
ncbi:MAG: hypothetical protein WBA91_01770 [Paracoccaceae bacterium]